MKNRVLIISIIIATALTALTWIFYDQIVVWLIDCLNKLHKPMASWALHKTIFALSIGITPILSFIVWNKSVKRTMGLLVAYNTIVWCMALLIIILTYILLDTFVKSESLLFPDYIVWLPFPSFWNYSLPLSILLTPTILFIIKISRNKTHNLSSWCTTFNWVNKQLAMNKTECLVLDILGLGFFIISSIRLIYPWYQHSGYFQLDFFLDIAEQNTGHYGTV